MKNLDEMEKAVILKTCMQIDLKLRKALDLVSEAIDVIENEKHASNLYRWTSIDTPYLVSANKLIRLIQQEAGAIVRTNDTNK